MGATYVASGAAIPIKARTPRDTPEHLAWWERRRGHVSVGGGAPRAVGPPDVFDDEQRRIAYIVRMTDKLQELMNFYYDMVPIVSPRQGGFLVSGQAG